MLVHSSEWEPMIKNLELKPLCARILEKTINDPDKYQPGLTKIFFRAGMLAALESLRSDRLNALVRLFTGPGIYEQAEPVCKYSRTHRFHLSALHVSRKLPEIPRQWHQHQNDTESKEGCPVEQSVKIPGRQKQLHNGDSWDRSMVVSSAPHDA